MTQTANPQNKLDVEAIVRLVVERVLRESTTNGNKQAAAPANPQSNSQSSSQRLRLGTKLLTLEVLRGKLDGISIVEVNPKTIVTPAVKDELRDRGIEMEYVTPQASEVTPNRSKTRILSSPDAACQSACKTIARICELKQHAPWDSSWPVQIAQSQKDDASQKWIVATTQPLHVVWDLQQAGVRAAICRTESDVNDASDSFSASAFVIDGRCGLSGDLVEALRRLR